MPIGFEVGSKAFIEAKEQGIEVRLEGKWSPLMAEAVYREMRRAIIRSGIDRKREIAEAEKKKKVVEEEKNPVIKELLKGAENA